MYVAIKEHVFSFGLCRQNLDLEMIQAHFEVHSIATAISNYPLYVNFFKKRYQDLSIAFSHSKGWKSLVSKFDL